MNSRRSGRALAFWGLAGLPLVMILVQSLLALLGENARSTGLVALIGPLYDIDVLYRAAVVFKSSPALVVGLFALIAVGWVGEGVAIAVRPHRDAAFAAAGFVSLLFVVLFFGVYSNLFAAGLPAVQLLAFFSIPVLTSGLVVAAAAARDWEFDIAESVGRTAGECETELERVRDRFETRFDERVGDPEPLRGLAPAAAEAAAERRDEFRSRLNGIRSDLEGSRATEAAAAREDVSNVRARVSELDPEGAATAADEAARRRLESAIRTTYGDVDVRAGDGGSYTAVNLPTEFREMPLSSASHPVHLGTVSEVLLDRLEDGERLEDVAAAAREVDARLDEIRQHVGEREEPVLSDLRAAETGMETLKSQLERLDGRVRERATELLVDGRSDAVAGVPALRDRTDEARQSLHACRFDEAGRVAASVAADAEGLTTASELLRGLSATASTGGRVALPDSVPPAFVSEISEAFRREHGSPLELSADESAVDVGGDAEAEPDAGIAPEPSVDGSDPDSEADFSETPDGTRPGLVVDEVLYAFRELGRSARESGDDHLQFQTDDLPSSVARPEVLETLRDYVEHQSDLVSHVELQSRTPPAFLEVEPQSGLSVREAIDGLERRYRERYA